MHEMTTVVWGKHTTGGGGGESETVGGGEGLSGASLEEEDEGMHGEWKRERKWRENVTP